MGLWPTATAVNLGNGTYTVTVTDAHNCTATTLATITEPGTLAVTGTVVNLTCVIPGSVTTTASGGTPPYQYFWDNGSTSSAITGLSAGTFSVTITDNHS